MFLASFSRIRPTAAGAALLERATRKVEGWHTAAMISCHAVYALPLIDLAQGVTDTWQPLAFIGTLPALFAYSMYGEYRWRHRAVRSLLTDDKLDLTDEERRKQLHELHKVYSPAGSFPLPLFVKDQE